MNRFAEIFRKSCPDFVHPLEVFDSIAESHIFEGAFILDAGCGRGESFNYSNKNQVKIVGIDLSKAIAGNRQLSYATQGDLSLLPFKDNRFDLIISLRDGTFKISRESI